MLNRKQLHLKIHHRKPCWLSFQLSFEGFPDQKLTNENKGWRAWLDQFILSLYLAYLEQAHERKISLQFIKTNKPLTPKFLPSGKEWGMSEHYPDNSPNTEPPSFQIPGKQLLLLGSTEVGENPVWPTFCQTAARPTTTTTTPHIPGLSPVQSKQRQRHLFWPASVRGQRLESKDLIPAFPASIWKLPVTNGTTFSPLAGSKIRLWNVNQNPFHLQND